VSLTDSTQSGASDSSETLAANTQGVFLRVQADKVDRLMDLVGELVLAYPKLYIAPIWSGWNYPNLKSPRTGYG